MNEHTKLRIFAALIILTLLLTGYLVKDKLPKENEMSMFEKYHLYH
jgi:hypothetical protein